MSVNPYKWIVGLYSEEAMLSYHGKAAMVEAGVADLAPHLFGVADHAYSQLVSTRVHGALGDAPVEPLPWLIIDITSSIARQLGGVCLGFEQSFSWKVKV